MNRRSIITAATALAASTAVPIAMANVAKSDAEEPNAHAYRLMQELADVLPLVLHGGFRAVVEPKGGWIGFQAIGGTTDPQLLFNQGIALRRLLILADGRSSAARYARGVLAETDKALAHRWRR